MAYARDSKLRFILEEPETSGACIEHRSIARWVLRKLRLQQMGLWHGLQALRNSLAPAEPLVRHDNLLASYRSVGSPLPWQGLELRTRGSIDGR